MPIRRARSAGGQSLSGSCQRADLLDALQRSVRAAKRGAGKDTEDVSDMSKTQLSKLAKKLDIKGRSTMTADQLRKAVKRAA